MSNFIFWGSKITADGDCSHEIKRHLLLGRKVMTNLDVQHHFSLVRLCATPQTTALLISWLQSPSAVILEPQKIKFVTVSTVSPSICHDLSFLNVEL